MRDVLYNEHCWIQHAAMQAGLDIIPTHRYDSNLTVIDYGCAQGANSIEPIQKVVSSLPKDATATVLFEDTPWNDWSTLAKTIHDGAQELFSADQHVRVFPRMVPIGFYEQVIPDNSADVGFSWSSMNYLETQPTVSLDPTTSLAEFMVARGQAFAASAQTDFVKLLKLRAAEIRQGGYFIAAIGGQKPASDPRPSNTGFAPLQAAMMKMVQSGVLKPAELAQFALFPTHERTVEEIQNSLDSPDIAAFWDVEVLHPKLIVHPAWKTYESAVEAAADDAQKELALRDYAQATIQNLVSSSGWYWLEVLKEARGRNWQGGDALLEDLVHLAVQHCLENGKPEKVEIWHTYLRLQRKAT